MQKYIYPEIILEFLSQILASYSINTHASLPARRPAVNVRCRSQQMRSHREFPFLCVQVPVQVNKMLIDCSVFLWLPQ